MSLSTTEIDRFWQSIDHRGEVGQGVSEAHTDTPLFLWGTLGTPLVLPQPHYRLFIPSPYFVVGWGMIADAAGSAVVRVEHATYSGNQTAAFIDVTGGAYPSLAAQQAVLTLGLSTWSPTKWGMFDLLHVYVDTVDGILQELSFQLFTRRLTRVGLQGGIATSGGNSIVTSAGTPIVLSHP